MASTGDLLITLELLANKARELSAQVGWLEEMEDSGLSADDRYTLRKARNDVDEEIYEADRIRIGLGRSPQCPYTTRNGLRCKARHGHDGDCRVQECLFPGFGLDAEKSPPVVAPSPPPPAHGTAEDFSQRITSATTLRELAGIDVLLARSQVSPADKARLHGEYKIQKRAIMAACEPERTPSGSRAR